MSRTQIQQLAVVILLIAFGVLWSVSRQSSSTAVVQIPAPAAEAPPSPPSGLPIDAPPPEISRDLFLPPAPLRERILQREKEREQKARRMTSPPGPGSGAGPAPVDLSRFKLQGIFWGAARPQAIINRKIVSVGDEVEGAQITSISKDRVLLDLGGTEITLKPASALRGPGGARPPE